MDKRIEKNNQSLLAVKELLLEMISEPENFISQESITLALKSQGALAKLHNEDRKIYPSSINTQKRIAESLIEGGYNTIDKLRSNAQLALERKINEKNKLNKLTKTGLQDSVKELEAQLQLLREDLLLITLAFEKSLIQAVRYAEKADQTTLALCKKEQRELLSILSVRKTNISTNVVKINA